MWETNRVCRQFCRPKCAGSNYCWIILEPFSSENPVILKKFILNPHKKKKQNNKENTILALCAANLIVH